MSERTCPREGEVLAAIAAGAQATDLGRHLSGCTECREVLAVAGWLQGVARETDAGALPRAERVWWRAQVERRLAARHDLADRAARPIRWFERGAAAAVAMIATAHLWEQGVPTASVALARLSDPTTLGALTAALMTLAGLAAREAVRKP